MALETQVDTELGEEAAYWRIRRLGASDFEARYIIALGKGEAEHDVRGLGPPGPAEDPNDPAPAHEDSPG